MSDQSPLTTQKDASSFASLLASFTSAPKKSSEAWDDSALLDDVTTISYEQALRSNRRVPAIGPAPTQSPENPFAGIAPSKAVPDTSIKLRKTASITIRLTKAEEAQLHERAAAAELSISAYLRSCIFEAESLRAQVKEALSQMKAATTPEPRPQPKPAPNWRNRLLPHWRRSTSTKLADSSSSIR
jgi:hypothetical protein